MSEPMTEWLRVMLDEIARKRQEAEREAAERRARTEEAAADRRGPASRFEHSAKS